MHGMVAGLKGETGPPIHYPDFARLGDGGSVH
jgi:hypothetical protein